MKRLLATLFCLILSFATLGAHAQQQPARTYTQAELDAMLAPIALYPDPLLTNILTAAIYPFDVKAAADWSAANPNVIGDAALKAVDGELWHPAVKALVAYPDVLARMGESQQWVTDLGIAYQNQYPALAASIQGLRARAQSTGSLASNEQQTVYQQDNAIYVQPAYPNVAYAPYYDPMVVYGAWWWPAYYPVVWRPWIAYPVYVTRVVAPVAIPHPGHIWHPGHVQPVNGTPMPPHMVRQPVGQVRPTGALPMPTPRAMSPGPSQSQWQQQSRPAQWQQQSRPPQWQQSRPAQPQSQPYHAVPESRRAPIIHSGPAVAPNQMVRSAPVMHAQAPQMRSSSAAGGSFRGGSSSGGARASGGGHGGGGRRG